ncbi:MAG: excisionase [Pseudomonadota bacterium]
MKPAEQLISTRPAADFIGVSHAYLLKLLECGEILSQIDGRHRYVMLHELLRWKSERDLQRASALHDLARLDVSLIA